MDMDDHHCGVSGVCNHDDAECADCKDNGNAGTHYDSTKDTVTHIALVRVLMWQAAKTLVARAQAHDISKLTPPEKDTFDEYTPKLQGTTYGSDEYKEYLKAMRPALQHHYQHNRHHPEYHKLGIAGMDLIDIMEMLADWVAASCRHSDGDIWKSLEINRERFNIPPILYDILANTVRRMQWTTKQQQPVQESF